MLRGGLSGVNNQRPVIQDDRESAASMSAEKKKELRGVANLGVGEGSRRGAKATERRREIIGQKL